MAHIQHATRLLCVMKHLSWHVFETLFLIIVKFANTFGPTQDNMDSTCTVVLLLLEETVIV